MTIETFRGAVQSAVTTWMSANYPSVPLQLENADALDQDAVGVMWLDVEIKFFGGGNVTMGGRPRGRDHGTVNTNLYVKEGEGTLASDAIVEGLRELLRNRSIGGGVLSFPAYGAPPAALGWRQYGLKTPFRIDSA